LGAARCKKKLRAAREEHAMHRAWSFSPEWSRFFGLPGNSPLAADVLRRGPRHPASEAWRLVVLAAHLPQAAQIELIDGLARALRARRLVPEARPAWSFQPEALVQRARFGLVGEALRPQPSQAIRGLLREETREMLRTLEADLSRPERNWRLAMHCARVGQLYAELARKQRRLVPLEELHQALEALRAIAG
jgi:hypothetical protein